MTEKQKEGREGLELGFLGLSSPRIFSEKSLEENQEKMPRPVPVSYESGFIDPRKGKGWIALLNIDSKSEIVREFLTVNRIYGKGGYVFRFQGLLPEGSVLEVAEGGSWKNTYRFFARVKPDGSIENLGWTSSIETKKKVYDLLGSDRWSNAWKTSK